MRRAGRSLTIALSTALSVALPQGASATPEQIATYRDWFVYVNEVGDDKICYAVTTPKEKEPSSVRHGDVYVMVASWASGAASEQPSFMAGYPLRESPDPQIRIGSDRWDLFPSGNEGFVEASDEERRLVAAMRRGTDMRLSAMSERGTATEYSFSLLGVSAALDRASKACR
ncbi:invasion associated locus B family protein [Parvularcula dongshanensis]|uniref:Invasion protein IalB n=1 Tax=Parvularcula dongshanensis TaxID=1173995 RepID=A0A840I1I5_9PROT|nr:invasion associated locus B family protein [Parvularcula dongshanensis]MBB4658092.1 invasion protein IalB [Parvularcula dongshanensis]